MIRIDGEQYWLYTVVDPDSNELLYTNREPTRTNAIAHAFFAELREKHGVQDAVFFADGATPLKDACSLLTSISDTKDMEIGIAPNMSLEI